GVQIVDWGTWAHYLKPASKPDDFLNLLEKSVGPYNLGSEAHNLGFERLAPERTRDRLIKAVSRKGDAATWLMQQQEWDIAFIVFGETHVASHYCWLPEDEHPADPDSNQPVMRGVYEALDNAVADLIQMAGEECRVIIVSGDGVGRNNAGWHLLPNVLSELGYFFSADQSSEHAGETVQSSHDPIRMIRDLLPKNFRKSLARMLPTNLRDKLAQRVDTANFDWARSKVYCLPTDLEGCIRINLKGREPQGIVAPGAEYDALCDELSNQLMALQTTTGDRRAVRQVLRTDQAFPGRRRDYLPDLVVLWDDQAPITAIKSERVGVIEGISPDPRPGTHKSPGFALVSGAGVKATETVSQADILDLAPTLLSWYGIDRPAYMAGRAWNFGE
ncbi:MAG: alkaline phosphatase family protein, partial [Pseudomonadota bacterium]